MKGLRLPPIPANGKGELGKVQTYPKLLVLLASSVMGKERLQGEPYCLQIVGVKVGIKGWSQVVEGHKKQGKEIRCVLAKLGDC